MPNQTTELFTSQKSINNDELIPVTTNYSQLLTNPNSFETERQFCLDHFTNWPSDYQVEFVSRLLRHMTFYQHGIIEEVLKPMLMRDFIRDLSANGFSHVSERILSHLDAKSLASAEKVSKDWMVCVKRFYLWKKLLESRVRSDHLWWLILHQLKFDRYLRLVPNQNSVINQTSIGNLSISKNNFSSSVASSSSPEPSQLHQSFQYSSQLRTPLFYRALYPKIDDLVKKIKQRWREGDYRLHTIDCQSEGSKGVYCIQYDEEKIVSGLRDNTIKIWTLPGTILGTNSNYDSHILTKVLCGHNGSVLCLQYDSQLVVSGSSDSTVRVWRMGGDWECLNVLHGHTDAVLHLRFSNGLLVTCSKDRTIALWDMFMPTNIIRRRQLLGHRAAVNVVDFDHKFIVSASGDRTIKVWRLSNLLSDAKSNLSNDASVCGNSTSTSENNRAYEPTISDPNESLVHTLSGHKRGIACLHYKNKLVVSGSSDNTIRLWDVYEGVCIRILEGHKELVRCIRFDEHRIISGSYDGEIKVWDMAAALQENSQSSDLCIQTFFKHSGRVFRLQFDDLKIVSSSHDDKILIWDFAPSREALLEVARKLENKFSCSNPNNSETYTSQFDIADDGLAMGIDGEEFDEDGQSLEEDEAMIMNQDEEESSVLNIS